MAEYIDRETLRRQLLLLAERHAALGNVRVAQDYNWAITVLDGAPSGDVAPVIHGEWRHSRYEDCSESFELVKCSNCSHEAYAMAIYVRGGNYCPNCGAKMDGGDSDGR